MKGSYCPYCHGGRSMMLGDIYCSLQHQKSMDELSTGTLLVKSRRLEETAEHVSRLSIRCMLKGEQHYKVGGNDFIVNSDKYILVNEGQRYQTSFDAMEEQELFLVAFQPCFAERLYHSLTTPAERLLDDPQHSNLSKVFFFEKTYDQDPEIRTTLQHLRQLIDADLATKETIDLDAIYTKLFVRILRLQHALHNEVDSLKEVKRSTRVELYRRLSIAKDFIDAHVADPINTDDVARVACLSVHHFKREFRVLFGKSPHRYLLEARMQRARTLLHDTGMSISDIAWRCGFQDTSAFIRQFRVLHGQTPGYYRNSEPTGTMIAHSK
jgi:AraC family transcriptional regulator